MSPFARLTIFIFAAIATVSHAAPLTGMPSTGALPQPPTLPLGSAGDITKSLPARQLPVVGDLSLAGGLGEDLPVIDSLPVRELPNDSGLALADSDSTEDLPQSDDLPVIGFLPVRALPVVDDLPLVGGSMKERALAGSYGDLPIIGGLARRDLPALDETELPEAEMGDLNTDDDTPALTLDEDLPLDDGADADTAKLPVARGLTDESCARIVNDAESQLTPLLQQITSVTSGDKLDIDTLSPLVSQVGDILNDVTGKVAALSNVGETGRVSANDLSTTVAPFVNSILSTFNTIMETSSTETETVTATHILSGATTDLAGLLQSLKTVFGSDIDTVLVPLLQTSGQALQMVNSLGLNSITSDLPLAGKVNEVVSGLKNTGL